MSRLSSSVFLCLDKKIFLSTVNRGNGAMEQKIRMREIEVTHTVKRVEKLCPVCHRLFWGATLSRYCSRACRNRANYERHADEYREARRETYRRQRKGT